MTNRLARTALALTLTAAALAAGAPIAGADNPGTGATGPAQPNCLGFFASNAYPGTPVAGGNRKDLSATEGGLHYGDFASQAQPCF
ncbi:MAG: hypothetical protein ACJ76Z_13745 [Thermoleophilaceae bacterium]